MKIPQSKWLEKYLEEFEKGLSNSERAILVSGFLQGWAACLEIFGQGASHEVIERISNEVTNEGAYHLGKAAAKD